MAQQWRLQLPSAAVLKEKGCSVIAVAMVMD